MLYELCGVEFAQSSSNLATEHILEAVAKVAEGQRSDPFLKGTIIWRTPIMMRCEFAEMKSIDSTILLWLLLINNHEMGKSVRKNTSYPVCRQGLSFVWYLWRHWNAVRFVYRHYDKLLRQFLSIRHSYEFLSHNSMQCMQSTILIWHLTVCPSIRLSGK